MRGNEPPVPVDLDRIVGHRAVHKVIERALQRGSELTVTQHASPSQAGRQLLREFRAVAADMPALVPKIFRRWRVGSGLGHLSFLKPRCHVPLYGMLMAGTGRGGETPSKRDLVEKIEFTVKHG
ncbi:hypothetical protein KL86PLE_30028 [uncultured Pleomorphomonas sp.]|uniref:Uncharacterized protein n=1 Tax=uncultured Pleomorphomonas sp. TaxID=442121 RepID=A0A212LDF6_9HYPH|nr:hypothetical protein KL86PLE_30028 [uncultured Pleomorphomonas sp.]